MIAISYKAIYKVYFTCTYVCTEFYTKLKFNQSEYAFMENSGSANIGLLLSKTLSDNFTVKIYTADGTALGDKGGCHV